MLGPIATSLPTPGSTSDHLGLGRFFSREYANIEGGPESLVPGPEN